MLGARPKERRACVLHQMQPLLRQQGYSAFVDSKYYSSFLQRVADGTLRFEPITPFEGIRWWKAKDILFKTEYPSSARYTCTVMCESQLVEREGEKFKIQRAWEFSFAPHEPAPASACVDPFTLHPSKILWKPKFTDPPFEAIDFTTDWKAYLTFRQRNPTAPIHINQGPNTYECQARRENMLASPGAVCRIELWCPQTSRAMVVYLLK